MSEHFWATPLEERIKQSPLQVGEIFNDIEHESAAKQAFESIFNRFIVLRTGKKISLEYAYWYHTFTKSLRKEADKNKMLGEIKDFTIAVVPSEWNDRLFTNFTTQQLESLNSGDWDPLDLFLQCYATSNDYYSCVMQRICRLQVVPVADDNVGVFVNFETIHSQRVKFRAEKALADGTFSQEWGSIIAMVKSS